MQFYVLEPEEGRFSEKWAYGERVKPAPVADAGPVCPICNQTVGHLVWVPPFRVRLSTSIPRKWGDFVWGSFLGPPLISKKLLSLFQEGRLQGVLSSTLVEITSLGPKKAENFRPAPPEYFRITIPWDGANLDDAASRIIRRRLHCLYCREGYVERFDGIVLETDSWKGADIFQIRGLGGYFITTERFKEAVERNQLKNAKFITAGKYAYDESRTRFRSPWYIRE